MKHRAKPRPSQLPQYIFKVETLSHEGRGIAHYGTETNHPSEKQGKKVFIRYALPGETVKAQITHQAKKLEEADNIQLLSDPSPYRVEPICPHFGVCGGCNMQHIHPDEQIRLKHNVLKSHLEHFAGLQPEQWLTPLRSTRTDYRHKARIGVRYLPKQNQLLMGFREAQSNHLIEIKTCKILDQQLDSALPELKVLLESLTGKAAIGHIELAKGDSEIALLIRHTEKLKDVDVNRLREYALQKQWQLYLQPAGVDSLHRVDDPQASMQLHYRLNDFDIEFGFNPTDFTQVNPTVNPQMVKMACDLLDLQHGDSVLDLFCGLGNFSLPLARQVGANGNVVAVEGSEEMVKRGTENALNNGITNVTFYAQDLTKDFSQFSWAKQGFDALLIDPPRAGAEQVMHYVPNFGAKKIVYVSCNPATLARDAGILSQYGYQLRKAGVMDMFTHTGHVESIALFEKKQEINH
ncbi:23S rRNA (uracil(1939)-C(5))-methyltransferase RlmD [Acinetobacter sp. ANC 3832]|uniref:23S rRNA (uracil(1939)-C(5))-methyltransferase RlmD n=1 Tax=Acinetobacter sp. ANC 3832 TaxID=1977874 RepID=UPI000A3448FA|nr:23S rRNA (uracil(1939)-C(5))-methyltransferase RlmD [Acinetobacter sp. ANC 3832]OTG94180.1 23S rRNA (uracil(1939)-C(5))-methyltransferase [Acinetobacter sp. ANC 3832]